jgi:hypothetical protein
MAAIHLDPQAKGQFAGLTHQTLVCDDAGKPLGFFLPIDVYKKLVYQDVDVPFSEEELERRRREQGGLPLAQLLARVKSRVNSEAEQ